MTKGGRIFAGIFALIGGGILFLINLVVYLLLIGSSMTDPLTFVLYIMLYVIGGIGILAGILELVDKTAGAVLALIAGITGFVFCIWDYIHLTAIYGLPPAYAGVIVLLFFLPPGMILTAGIVGLAVGSE
jgi:hypothetical protein